MRSMRSPTKVPVAIIGLTVIFVLLASTGCTQDTQHATDTNNVPAGVNPSDANKLPTDVQNLQVSVAAGKFEHDRYTMQTGAVQMVVTAAGGPYKLSIDKLFADHAIAATSKTTIGFNAPNAGLHTMTLTDQNGTAQGTATLDVRPLGGK
ncbi:MAG: hypothetical protein M3Z04_25530 [Chloroflexota bacterium]|nr:hypothetical protein [Chloroflexota bacterium]